VALAALALFSTCAKPAKMPALDGAHIEIRRSGRPLRAGDPRYADTLQLYWFGTACHVIQLGELSLLTDPFVTNNLKLRGMESNPSRVSETFGRMAPPDAVLVNHSHHDHILDAYAAMTQPCWKSLEVPLFGGPSAVNLLAGYEAGLTSPRWHAVQHENTFQIETGEPGYRAKVTPYRSAHSPHLNYC
jgi:L-ascorbate metabolism protein UlaG (beta-lactamase superfamily)